MAQSNSHPKAAARREAEAAIERLKNAGVELIRLIYSDLHGIARSKDIPIELLGEVTHEGTAFCVAVVDMGLVGNPTNAPGMAPTRGYPDMTARPILSSLQVLPWESNTAWCLADLDIENEALDISPRHFLKRVIKRYEQLKLMPIAGPELEFFLLRLDEAGQPLRYTNRLSMVYTSGQRSDPEGVVREMLKAAERVSLAPVGVLIALESEYCDETAYWYHDMAALVANLSG